MNGAGAVAQRLCPDCGAAEATGSSEAVWPLSWRCKACGRTVPDAFGIPMFDPGLADTESGFDPAAFDRLAKIEETHFWFVARNELIVGLAEKYFPQARRYLEIGCGNGAVLQALDRSRSWDRIVGADLHPRGLAYARARLPQRVEFAQLDARAIPAEAAFDLIGAFDIIEHVADDEMVLRSMHRALAPGGGVLIAVPQHPVLWSRIDEMGRHQRRYRRGEMERKLERNSFTILFSSSYTSVLLPLMAVSRLKTRFWPSGEDADVSREFGVGPVANRVLSTVLRSEVRLTVAGTRWPFGGSRLVAARAV